MLNVNNENSGCSFYFTQNISEHNITRTAKLTKRGIPRCWFKKKYDQRKIDLHLTQLNCAIANWATMIRIICRPTQMLLAFATGWPLILIPVLMCFFFIVLRASNIFTLSYGFWDKLNRNRQKINNLQIFTFSLVIKCYAVFSKMLIFVGYLWFNKDNV